MVIISGHVVSHITVKAHHSLYLLILPDMDIIHIIIIVYLVTFFMPVLQYLIIFSLQLLNLSTGEAPLRRRHPSHILAGFTSQYQRTWRQPRMPCSLPWRPHPSQRECQLALTLSDGSQDNVTDSVDSDPHRYPELRDPETHPQYSIQFCPAVHNTILANWPVHMLKSLVG